MTYRHAFCAIFIEIKMFQKRKNLNVKIHKSSNIKYEKVLF